MTVRAPGVLMVVVAARVGMALLARAPIGDGID